MIEDHIAQILLAVRDGIEEARKAGLHAGYPESVEIDLQYEHTGARIRFTVPFPARVETPGEAFFIPG